MRRKYKFNMPRLSPIDKVLIGLCGTIIGALGIITVDAVNGDPYADLTDGKDKLERNGIEYELSGPHSISYEESGVSYSFNFNNRVVTIDGRDEADSVYSFDNYPSPHAIEDSRQGGCQISTGISAIFADEAYQETLEGRPESANALKKKSEIFSTSYCTNMPELANTP